MWTSSFAAWCLPNRWSPKRPQNQHLVSALLCSPIHKEHWKPIKNGGKIFRKLQPWENHGIPKYKTTTIATYVESTIMLYDQGVSIVRSNRQTNIPNRQFLNYTHAVITSVIPRRSTVKILLSLSILRKQSTEGLNRKTSGMATSMMSSSKRTHTVSNRVLHRMISLMYCLGIR